MATLDGNLWDYNFTKVVLLDVSDDYTLMQEPMPACCYPVLGEVLVPVAELPGGFARRNWMQGYLYDWHETDVTTKAWYVGVVRQELAERLLGQA